MNFINIIKKCPVCQSPTVLYSPIEARCSLDSAHISIEYKYIYIYQGKYANICLGKMGKNTGYFINFDINQNMIRDISIPEFDFNDWENVLNKYLKMKSFL